MGQFVKQMLMEKSKVSKNSSKISISMIRIIKISIIRINKIKLISLNGIHFMPLPNFKF